MGSQERRECLGIAISQHDGEAAGQDIFHLHLHVIRRYRRQRLPRFEKIGEVSRWKLDEAARRIRHYI